MVTGTGVLNVDLDPRNFSFSWFQIRKSTLIGQEMDLTSSGRSFLIKAGEDVGVEVGVGGCELDAKLNVSLGGACSLSCEL